jgi:hypothetical protein
MKRSQTMLSGPRVGHEHVRSSPVMRITNCPQELEAKEDIRGLMLLTRMLQNITSPLPWALLP